ncbi:MAG: DNA mismatch endonuclease Vsr [Acidobacteria bacterium]|nr:DNA mismatch endonuclease Vsr [Acidobacteriota bacterium]
MTDTFSRQRRSEIMGRIRSTDTRAELTVRSMLHRAGFRFRLHSKSLPGKPDIVMPGRKTVILIHGCLWHGHENCRRGRRPKSNTEYWNRKIDRNLSRDAANAELLRELGWKQIVVWECELKNMDALRERLISQLTNDEPSNRNTRSAREA